MTRLVQVGPEYADAAMEFCRQQPERCTYIAGWIYDGGLAGRPAAAKAWLLVEQSQSRELVGVAYLSATGIVIPVLHSDSALDQLVALARSNPGLIRVLVGERSQTERLWRRLQRCGMHERLARDQLVYAVKREGFEPVVSELRLDVASELDLDDVVRLSAAMAREEARDDPQARNPALFRERIRTRLARGRDFIHRIEGQLAFKSNVSALSPMGGQLEGVYTIHELRRKQLARRGTSTITSWILERAQRAVLLVNDDNLPARSLYESLGYTIMHESRTVFAAP